MITGLDLGGSFVKRLNLTNDWGITSKSLLPAMDFKQFLAENNSAEIDRFVLTGGKSLQASELKISQEITLIHEFEAMRYFLKSKAIDEGVLASLGTGIPILEIKKTGYTHLTGTGIGGGTIIGLGSRLLNISNFSRLEQLAIDGDSTQVNILVGEIIGSGIGLASASATAANFGKPVSNEQEEDVAAAIFQMVCESIAMLTGFAARELEKEKIHFIGTLSKSPVVKDLIAHALQRYDVKAVFYQHPEFAAILGAIEKFKE